MPDDDGLGCYPIFTCQDWSQIESDLDAMTNDLVSLVLVTDPFGDYDLAHLRRCFPHRVIPFKEHYVIKLDRAPETFVSHHHRRNARQALHNLRVFKCAEPRQCLEPWLELYATLIKRHNITGIRVFSRTAFAQQLDVPGSVLFRAVYRDTTVGMLWWYVQGQFGYYHLGAYSSLGYQMQASFALFWYAIAHFATCGLERLDLGAGAGLQPNASDGLSRFKRGWATGTATAYLCGRILQPTRYAKLVMATGTAQSSYFPAYRHGEFG